MSTNKDITLYLDNRNPPPVVTVSQGDTDWLYRFTIKYNDATYAPTVNYVILTGHKPDGHVFAYRGAKSGNLYTVTPANANGNLVQMTAVAGDVPCELRLISGGRSVGTANFILRVEPGPEGVVTVASASALNAYTTILQELGVLIGKVETLPDDVPGWIGDWLEEHISGGQGVAVDNTLSIQGAAADAKATGDRLTALEEATIETDDTLTVSGAAADAAAVGLILYGEASEESEAITGLTWQLRSTINGSGETVINNPQASKGALSSEYYLQSGGGRSFTFTGSLTDLEGYVLASFMHEFNAAGTWLGRTSLAGSPPPTVKVNDLCAYVRFTLQRASNGGQDVAMDQRTIDGCFEVSAGVPASNGLISRVEALEGESEYQAGKTYYFTVPVNQSFADTAGTSGNVQDSENYANVECVVKLPGSYAAKGKPTPVLMCAHGTSGWVSGSAYQTQLDRWNDMLSDGFALFDVNGGMPFDSESAHTAGQCMGGPRAVEAYFKAFEWIRQHLNVEPLLYVGGLSMGGLAALNFANRHPEIVKCVGLFYPVTSLYNQAWLHPWYTGTGAATTKGCIAREYNFASASEYEAAKTVGYDPENNRRFLIGEAPVCLLPVPVKIWHGDNDTTVSPAYSASLINAIRAAGGIAEMRTVGGAGHGESTFSGWADIIAVEGKAWFNRFRLKESS